MTQDDHLAMRYRVDLQQGLVDDQIVEYTRGAEVTWPRYSGRIEVSIVLAPNADAALVQEHWVRAHYARPGDLPYLRDLNEFAPDPGATTARARLHMSAQTPPEHLRIDVTNHPEQSPVTPRNQARYDALAEGRSAASQERRAEWSQAEVSWKRCAVQWEQADRPDLAALALKRSGLASRTAENPVAAAEVEQLAHELADELAQPWIFEHLGRLRPKVPPFDAEVIS